jgi:two-component system, response regulator RegA
MNLPVCISQRSAALSRTLATRRGCERLLVIEGNEALRCALVQALAVHASEARGAASVTEVRLIIAAWHPDAVVLDCDLPDGTSFDVLRAIIEAGPMPDVVAISGAAGPAEGFRLAQMGVRAFVPRPATPAMIERVLDAALGTVPDVAPLVRTLVGRLGVHEAEEQVRATMVAEALARANGNRRIAARLLSISRQLLQHILRKGD